MCSPFFCVLFSNDTATTEIYTLSLHDALPISRAGRAGEQAPPANPGPLDGGADRRPAQGTLRPGNRAAEPARSEEHTSELQSRQYLVCRLLLEKTKKQPKVTRVHFREIGREFC